MSSGPEAGLPRPGAGRGQAPVGLAAVGLGRWARVMARAYAGSPLVELRTCYTRNPERRQAFAADFGCGQDESLEAVLARDDIDGMVITAPNDQHAPIIEAAAARGKHVYTEKPVAVNLADLRRIRAGRCSAPRIVFACGHSARRLSGLRAMKRPAGQRGGGRAVHGGGGVRERARPRAEGRDWRADPVQAPGGPLTQLGIHQIDNLQYLLGHARRAVAMGQAPRPGIANELAVGVLLEFDESLGYLGCNWLSPGSFTIDVYAPPPGSATSWTSPGGATRTQTDAHTRLTRTIIAADSAEPGRPRAGHGGGAAAAARSSPGGDRGVRRAIARHGPVEVGLAEAVANVAVLQAAARSLRTDARPVRGRPRSWPRST